MEPPSRSTAQSLFHRLDRRAFLRGALAAGAGGAAFYALGCGGSSKSATPTALPTATPRMGDATPATGKITPSLLTSEFVAGQDNRFAVGLVNAERKLVKDAKVRLSFFTLGADGTTGTLRGEGDATLVELSVASPQNGADESVAFYTATAPFDVAGKWAVKILVAPKDGSAGTMIDAPFEVLAASPTPAIGSVAPASRNDTMATNSNPASLCSRVPVCPLHDKVIADLVGKGRPLVVQFSTPAFCQTRFCGPVLEVLLNQAPKYQDRIDFVHIEVWQDFQLQQYRPAMRDWNLSTEPWTFFVGSDGKVKGKLESIFSDEELTSALEQLLKL